MADFELQAQTRSEQGTGAARRMRRNGEVPAILYGAGREPAALKLSEHRLRRLLMNETFFSHVLTIQVEGGGEEQAVIKALQRHPANERILHMDLLRVSATQRLTIRVPIHFENEDTSPGRKAGGAISHHITEVEVSCLPKDIPEYLVVDMSEIDIGDSVHMSSIPLPEGVEIPALGHGPEHDQPVVSVNVARATEIEPEETDEEELPEGEEAPEGAEAPAAESGDDAEAADGGDDG